MDKPFTGANGNYEECLRYYQKTYNYAAKSGTNTAAGCISFLTSVSTTSVQLPLRFIKPMAKTPTVNTYGYTGTPNAVNYAGTDYGINSHINAGEGGFGGWVHSSAAPANTAGNCHYTADTAW
jgi:hypothetical protein